MYRQYDLVLPTTVGLLNKYTVAQALITHTHIYIYIFSRYYSYLQRMMILYATTMWSDKQKDDRNRQVSVYDNDPGPAGDYILW